MKSKIRVSILDDNLPKLQETVGQDIYKSGINQDELLVLAEKGSWTGELPLQQLVFSLLNHEYLRTGLLEIVGYTNPEQILSDVDARPPNVVIYDWEYGIHSPSESENWLFELLEVTAAFDAFIFVYSKVPSQAPESSQRFLIQRNLMRLLRGFNCLKRAILIPSLPRRISFISTFLPGSVRAT